MPTSLSVDLAMEAVAVFADRSTTGVGSPGSSPAASTTVVPYRPL
jgi:hypothetical protein